jgi:hypothetical protein
MIESCRNDASHENISCTLRFNISIFTSAALASSFDVSPKRFAAQLRDTAAEIATNPDFQALECRLEENKGGGTGTTYSCGIKAGGVRSAVNFLWNRPSAKDI